MKTLSPKRKTAVLLWPANIESHRQRIVGFFREAAINDRLAAFLVDISQASWQHELKTLVRDLKIDLLAAHPDCAPSLRRLIRQTRLQAQIHILDVGTGMRDFRYYVDNRAIGVAAAEFFLARGIRHLGYVGFAREPQHSEPRRLAFREAIIRGNARYCGDFCWSKTNRTTKKFFDFLSAIPKPCGIFTYNDSVAHDLVTFCQTHEFMIPDTVAILGVDDDKSICESSLPSISSVATDFFTFGRYACRLIRDGEAAADSLPLPRAPFVHERDSTRPTNSQNRLVNAAQKLIEQHGGNLTVSTLTRALNVSEQMLNLSFKKLLAIGPKEAIIDYRLQRAQNLLATTRLPIGEVASKAGFPSAANFHRNFTRAFDRSPSAYRESEARLISSSNSQLQRR